MTLPNRPSPWHAAAAVLCLLLTGLPVRAHDLWIAPSEFRPAPDQSIDLRLQVGIHLAGEPIPLIPPLVKRFFVRRVDAPAGGEQAVASRRGAGADPAGQWRAGAPGLHVIGYQSHASRVALDAEKFNAYLLEEGLDGVLALRMARGQHHTATSERFARCAKSLLQVGPVMAGQRDTDLGCALELVVDGNPYAGATRLSFRLSYRGQPLAGTLVTALSARDPAHAASARTDVDGHVQLDLHTQGLWLIKAVHTVPAEQGIDADWQSYWASVTFER